MLTRGVADRYVLTLDGPVPITNGSHKADSQLPAHDRGGRCDAFEAIITRIRERGGHLSKAPMMSSPFPLRGCNIVDPINGANNLGFNVTKDCLERIDVALKGGHHHLETLVRMINHARQPLQVAPALSLSYDPSGSSMSAFNMPPSTNGGVTYASHFLSTNGGNSGPPPVTTNSTRPRAESVGGIAMHSSLGEIDGSYGVKSAGVGSEYLTVFFAQCRARYMLNSGCRHDLLDHPKQKGSFFGQMGRPESGSSSSSLRPGSAPTEGSGSETQPRYCDDATDPLSGNIADMWGIYLKANESMRRAADVKNTAITSQKHTFSVLSPTSDLTEVAKYDVDHLDNSSSSESHGVESSKDFDEIKRNVALSASPTGAPEQTNATLSKESYVLSSLCTRREKDSHNPAKLSSDATIDERVLGSPDTGPLVTKQRKGSKSRSKTTEEIQIDRKPDIGAQQSVVLDSKQMLTPPIPISEVDAPTVSPVAQNIVVEVETVAVQTHDDWKKDMYQTDEYVSFFSNNRMNAVAAICTLLIFIVAAYALGKSSSDLASRGTALTGARGAIGADTGDNESATSVVSAAAEDNCSVEVNLLLKCKYICNTSYCIECRFFTNDAVDIVDLESSTPQPARSLALSTLEQWTTKGSNISIAASDHLARAYVELNGCYAQSSKCVNMVSLRPATGTDESIDRSDTCHNYSARSQHVINFAWHRHGDHNPSTVCQRGPCTLSVFNIQSKDEGQYDLIMSKWNMLSTTSDVDVIVSSLIIRVSGTTFHYCTLYIRLLYTFSLCPEPPISSSKAVYLTLGMGASLYLHIKAEGVPEPSLQWYKNGFVLPGQNRPVLHIHSVNKFDEGTYTCELRNIAGTYVWQEGAVSVRSVVPPPLPTRHN